MRVDEPFGNEAKAGLNLFKVIAPDLWVRVVNRVSGANFGNIYSGNKIMSARYSLPKIIHGKALLNFYYLLYRQRQLICIKQSL